MTDTVESGDAQPMIKVWDRVVRVGHWVLVGGFAIAYLTGEDGPEGLHVWAGYAIAVTVALRVVWGFIGPEKARFSDFVTGPGRALSYLQGLLKGTAPRYVGHSPAGGLMAVALLAMMAGTVWTGMILYAQEENAGPLAPFYGNQTAALEMPSLISPAMADEDDDDDEHEGREGRGGEGGESMEELHEFFANAVLFLALLHVGGVILASRAHHENLVRGMIDGMKRP
jgi:cytochrome b